MTTMDIIGQIFGIIAVLLGFLTYQMKSAKQLVLVQIATTVVFCIHYLLIGAISACALNAVSFVRNIVYFSSDKKIFASPVYPYVFAVVMGIMGALSWQGMFSLFVIAGLVINTVCMSLKNPQSIRKSILVTSPMVLIYDVWSGSFGGVIYESVAIVSSVIGILRNIRKNK